MLEVKIPAEIHDYKSKIIAGLSVRQLIAVGVAFLVAVPLGILGKGRISEEILPWIIILAVAPCVGFGWFKFQGMNFEDYMRSWITFNLMPQKRVYEDTNGLLQELHEEALFAEIRKQRIDSGEIEDPNEMEG